MSEREVSNDERDEELRWRLEVLKSKLDEGKIHIAEHLIEGVQESLANVRYRRDGLIDLSTVDGRVRSMALMSAMMHDRDQKKSSAPLEDVTNLYFELIEKNLGFIAEAAKDNKLNAHEFGVAISRSPQHVGDISPQIPAFLDMISQFWEEVGDATHYHIQDLNCTKAVYGGDLFPSYQRNIASSAGLYIDTIVLSDPFLQSREVILRSTPDMQLYYLAKHTINVLGYRSLALARLDSPIIIISPFKSSIDDDERDFIKRLAEPDALLHAGKIFGRSFENFDELMHFTDPLRTVEDAVSKVANKERLLFDSDWTGPLDQQLARIIKTHGRMLPSGGHPGQTVALQCLTRMMQATDILIKSRYLHGTPIIDAPTSWKYFNWKLEYNSAITSDATHLHMLKGLQRVAETDMEWLGNIPSEALIDMRKQGAFDEIRHMLSSGVKEISEIKPDAFFRSSDRIVSNIQDAFSEHQNKMREIKSKGWRFAGKDLGSWVATGAIEIAAIATGTPSFGVGAFVVNQLIDAPKLKDIPAKFRDLKNAHVELKKSPMGLLFKHVN